MQGCLGQGIWHNGNSIDSKVERLKFEYHMQHFSCTEPQASHWASFLSAVMGLAIIATSQSCKREDAREMNVWTLEHSAIIGWLLSHTFISPRVKHNVLNINSTQYLLVEWKTFHWNSELTLRDKNWEFSSSWDTFQRQGNSNCEASLVFPKTQSMFNDLRLSLWHLRAYYFSDITQTPLPSSVVYFSRILFP